MTASILTADRLIDGTGGPPLDHGGVVVVDGKITGVFQGHLPEGMAPAHATTMALPGCTLLPGLIDTHVHLNLPADGTLLEATLPESDGVLLAVAAHSARRALDAGITTVRDLGAARNTVFDLRRALQLGWGVGPRILACGQAITITGGHLRYWGGEADGPDALRRKVREMARAGADFIKVMASGGGTVGTMPWLPAFSLEELRVLADEAHRLGRMITAHCLCAASIDLVLQAGFDMIEHAGFLVDSGRKQVFEPDIALRIARAGIPVTATLAVGGYVLRALEAIASRTPAEDEMLTRWRRTADANLSQFRKMHVAGVKYVAGTDAGWRHTAFEGVPLELALMHRGGMPAAEAIHAATGRAAEVIGIAAEVGTLRPGLAADIIAVGGNPLDDLARLHDVRLVMQAGRVHAARPPAA